jgi:hypothetical protein
MTSESPGEGDRRGFLPSGLPTVSEYRGAGNRGQSAGAHGIVWFLRGGRIAPTGGLGG